jgi:hypothetical protein
MPININTYCRVNRNGSININTDPTFGFLYTGPICVSGSSIAQVNGTYTFYAYYTQNGYTRPNYTINPAPFVYYNIDNLTGNGAYRIVEGFGDSNDIAFGNTFPPPENPYLETSWTDPNIVITRGPC